MADIPNLDCHRPAGALKLPGLGGKAMTAAEFLWALGAIVVIDLVLAGDNAIVIALAARNLPEALRRRAILWGTAGAVAVRSALTLAVVWILKLPGLLFIGGALLVWIAYRLLVPDEEPAGEGHDAATNFWGAMRTIVIADALMGLDNVLGVAGAAHGNYLLVVIGLLISIPIMVWGSTLILHFVERHPGFVYLGAGVLALTAGKMMLHEPFVAEQVSNGFAQAAIIALLVLAVLWAGFARNHRRLESRISAHLAAFAGRRLSEAAAPESTLEGGETQMVKVLVPVNGTDGSQHAVRHVLAQFLKGTGLEIHLLNVQPPFSRHIAQFASRRSRADFHRERAEKALEPARAILDGHKVPYAVHTALGDRAEVIAETARKLRCHHIVMSTARKNSLTRMLEDSVTNRVLELTPVPVEVIAGESISPVERYGIPVGIGTALAALVVAALD
jgi:YjbE family integral membrane protein